MTFKTTTYVSVILICIMFLSIMFLFMVIANKDQSENIQILQAQVKAIEERNETLTEQLAYHKAFIYKDTKRIVEDALMVECEIEGTEKTSLISLNELIKLVINDLGLSIIKVPATGVGYRLDLR